MENIKINLKPKLRFSEFQSNWHHAVLEDYFDFKNGLNKEKEYFGRGTPIINFTDVYHLVNIKKNNIKGLVELNSSEIERYSAKVGDVFFTRTSETIIDIGMSATLVENIDNCVFSGFVLRARPIKNDFIPLFTSYCFNIHSIRKEIVTKSSFTTRALTSGTLLKKVVFNFPKDKKEQLKIADFLSEIDKKIELLSKKKKRLEEFKKGIMQKVFSQEIRFKKDNGSDYTDWEYKKIGEVGEIITGKTPSTKDASLWNGDIQFITPTDIIGSKYQINTQRTVKHHDKMKILPSKSILFTCIASIGKMVLSIKPCITNQQINTIIPDESHNNEYIYYALLNITEYIKSTQSNTTLPIINKTEFSKFIISIPNFEEQTKIANFLSEFDKKINQVSNKLDELKQLKKGLLQQMFI